MARGMHIALQNHWASWQGEQRGSADLMSALAAVEIAHTQAGIHHISHT